MSSLSNFFLGQPGRIEAVPTGTQQQQDLISQLLGGLTGQQFGGGPLGAGLQNIFGLLSGAPEALEAFQAPALRQFQERIIPGIAEQFSGAGTGDSSAFGQQLGAAGAGLAERLSAQRGGLQQQALSQLQGLLGLAQRPQFEPTAIPGSRGLLQPLAEGLGGGLGQLGGIGLGGGILKLLSGLFGKGG